VPGRSQFAEKRSSNLNFPTTKEMGFDSDISHWQGLIAPKGLPQEAMDKLASVVKEIVESPEFAAELDKISTSAAWMGPEQFKTFFDKEFDMYGEVLRNLVQK